DQWSPAGQLLHSFSGAEPGRKPFTRPAGVAVNTYGLLYVTDRGTSQFRELDPLGHNSGLFGRQCAGDGDLRAAEGIGAAGESVWITDPGNHRVCQFVLSRQTPLPPLTPVPAIRVQVALKNLWPVSADSVALSPESRLLALNGTTG